MPALILLLLLAPRAALAHGLEADGIDLGPLFLLPLLALYLLGRDRLARRGTGAAGFDSRALLFFAGLAALLVALLPPLHSVAERLFWAHMVEHELLMLVAAPLLVLARPGAALLWALPQRCRRLAVALHPAWRRLTHPLASFVLQSTVLWAWHVPALFEAALRDEALHWLQHLSFFAAAGIYWAAVLQPRAGQAGRGGAILSLFGSCVQCGLLGALLTMAGRPWYGAYGLEDQQLAGLAMWVPASMAYTLAAVPLVVAWLRESEHRTRLWEAKL